MEPKIALKQIISSVSNRGNRERRILYYCFYNLVIIMIQTS